MDLSQGDAAALIWKAGQAKLNYLVLSTQYLVRSTWLCAPRSIPIGLAAFWLAAAARAEFPRVPPTPPEKAEATFEVQHGFRMELIAAEPLVASPVDLAYDENGRAYVVEMRDYPYPEEKNAAPTEFPGTVRLAGPKLARIRRTVRARERAYLEARIGEEDLARSVSSVVAHAATANTLGARRRAFDRSLRLG